MDNRFLTDDEYYNDKEYLSNSMLKDFQECPYKFYQKHITKEFAFQDQPYFLIGRALDTLITEGQDAFIEKFQVVKTRRGVVSDKQLLTEGDYKLISMMYNEVYRQPLFRKLRFSKTKCQEIIALEIDGVKRKGKMDFFDKKKKIIVDLKSAANLFMFDPLVYAQQLAYYKQLVRAKYGFEAECHLFVVDKQKPKCRSQYFIYSTEILDEAEDRINESVQQYVKYMKGRKKLIQPRYRSSCMDCQFYQNCKLSTQKTPIYLTKSDVTNH